MLFKQNLGVHSYSAGSSASEAPQDLGRAILAIIFMVLSCGGGIGWKIYRCYRKGKRRKSIAMRIPYPNNIYVNPISTYTADRLSESDVRDEFPISFRM